MKIPGKTFQNTGRSKSFRRVEGGEWMVEGGEWYSRSRVNSYQGVFGVKSTTSSSGQNASEWQVEIPPQLLQFGGGELLSLKFLFLILNKFFFRNWKKSRCFELCRRTNGQNLAPLHSFKKQFLVEKHFFFKNFDFGGFFA